MVAAPSRGRALVAQAPRQQRLLDVVLQLLPGRGVREIHPVVVVARGTGGRRRRRRRAAGSRVEPVDSHAARRRASTTTHSLERNSNSDK